LWSFATRACSLCGPGCWAPCSDCSDHDVCLCGTFLQASLLLTPVVPARGVRSCLRLLFPCLCWAATPGAVCRSVVVQLVWLLLVWGCGMVLVCAGRLALCFGVFLWFLLSVYMLQAFASLHRFVTQLLKRRAQPSSTSVLHRGKRHISKQCRSEGSPTHEQRNV
jgi:hypothetical protein